MSEPREARRAVGDLGSNAGMVEDMYREYVEHPESLSDAWREFFADYVPVFEEEHEAQVRVPPPTPAARLHSP